MPRYSMNIDDAVAEASPVLRRMQLEGFDRATLPFAERYVLAWLSFPKTHMGLEILVQVFKVGLSSGSVPTCRGTPCKVALP